MDENKWVIEKVNAFSSMKEDQIKTRPHQGQLMMSHQFLVLLLPGKSKNKIIDIFVLKSNL